MHNSVIVVYPKFLSKTFLGMYVIAGITMIPYMREIHVTEKKTCFLNSNVTNCISFISFVRRLTYETFLGKSTPC